MIDVLQQAAGSVALGGGSCRRHADEWGTDRTVRAEYVLRNADQGIARRRARPIFMHSGLKVARRRYDKPKSPARFRPAFNPMHATT
jgi:hypothetical protein